MAHREIISDIKNTFLSPKYYYSHIDREYNTLELFLKAVILFIVLGLMEVFKFIFRLEIETFAESLSIIVAILFLGTIVLIAVSLLVKLLSKISGLNGNFENSLEISVSLIPVVLLASVVDWIFCFNNTIQLVMTAIVYGYGIYILYNAFVYGLEAKKSHSKITALLCTIILTVFTTGAFISNIQGENLQKQSNLFLKLFSRENNIFLKMN